jgi:hypothetical protein
MRVSMVIHRNSHEALESPAEIDPKLTRAVLSPDQHDSGWHPILVFSSIMEIDEDTPGSLANGEGVRVLKGWLIALYVVDCLVCVMGALNESHSMSYGFWLLFKSLLFSYFVGIALLIVTIRYFGRLIGITKISAVGLLRYCVVFACISVIMGALLVHRASSATSTVHTAISTTN